MYVNFSGKIFHESLKKVVCLKQTLQPFLFPGNEHALVYNFHSYSIRYHEDFGAVATGE